LLDSLRTLVDGAAGLVHTRLELLGADLRAERARLTAAVLVSLAVLFFAAIGIVFAAFAIMLAAWDHFRFGAAALLALAFLAAAVYGGFRLQRFAQQQPRMFEASLAALEGDREQLARPAPKARLAERAVEVGQWIAAGLMLYTVVRRALGRR
jgi:uncharacterized membrane protein YqjE